MEITLGVKIRELRKKHNLTQEDLAAKLSISAQAISKWENNTCYPDMAQIPILANFFGVSLDELFSYDVTQLNHRIDGIIAEAKKYFWENPNKCKEIYQTALKEYPANERLLTELLEVCITHGSNKEALSIAERLVEEAKDVFSVCRAKASLVELYLRADQYDDAKKVIESLPEIYPYMLCDKMRTSSYSLRGDDRLKWAKDWKTIEIQELYTACQLEGKGYWEVGNYEGALASFSQYRRVIEMFMRSEEININSYLWSGMQTHHWCAYLEEAGCLVKLRRMDEAKAKIDRAHYILMNSWKEKDSSVNYLENKPERYLAPFREYYSEWELDAAFPCPI